MPNWHWTGCLRFRLKVLKSRKRFFTAEDAEVRSVFIVLRLQRRNQVTLFSASSAVKLLLFCISIQLKKITIKKL